MEKTLVPSQGLLSAGYLLAPLQPVEDHARLGLCLLVRLEWDAINGPFVLLREVPLARVYLGAVSDAQGRVQEWVAVWCQSFEAAEIVADRSHERLSNFSFGS